MNSPEENAALIRRLYEEFFNRSNVAFADEAHGHGYAYHDLTNPGETIDHAA